MTISKFVLASLAVWRISSMLFGNRGYGRSSRTVPKKQENIFGNRVLDLCCWLGIWFSAQTTLWVAGGLAGVLLNWLLLSALSRFFMPAADSANREFLSQEAPAQLRAAALNGDLSCLSIEHTLQATHG